MNALKKMNTEVEKMTSQGVEPQPHFQQDYANVVLELESINQKLNGELRGIEGHCQQVRNWDEVNNYAFSLTLQQYKS